MNTGADKGSVLPSVDEVDQPQAKLPTCAKDALVEKTSASAELPVAAEPSKSSEDAESDDPADQDAPENPENAEGDDSSDDFDPHVAQTIGKLLDMVHSEGLDSVAAESAQIAEVLERTKGIALEADEVYRAIAETKRLQREMEQVERQVGLSDANLPRGKFGSREADATDAVPCALTPDELDSLYIELATALDRIAAMSANAADAEVMNAMGNYADHRRQALDAIDKLTVYGADPRAAVFSEYRLEAWLTLQMERMTGSNVLSLRQARQIMKNSLLKHREVLAQRKAWYADHRNNDAPLLGDLVRDVERVQKALGERVDRFPEIFTGEDRETLQKFLPAIDEYCKEVTRFGIAKPSCYVSLPSELLDVQQAVAVSRNFQTVRDASVRLQKGMQRLYLNHWICESLLGQIRRKDESVRRHTPPDSPHFAGILLNVIRKRHKTEPTLKKLQSAIGFRNSIAHDGRVWDPGGFEKHITAYERGIDTLCRLYGVTLEAIKVKSPSRPKPVGAFLKRLDAAVVGELDMDRFYTLLGRDRVESKLRNFISSRDEVADGDIEYFMKQQMYDYVAAELLDIHPRRAKDAFRAWAREEQHHMVRHANDPGAAMLGRLAWAYFKDPDSRDTAETLSLARTAVESYADKC